MFSKLKFTKSAIYDIKFNCKTDNNIDWYENKRVLFPYPPHSQTNFIIIISASLSSSRNARRGDFDLITLINDTVQSVYLTPISIL